MIKDKTALIGIRPVALEAVSERERLLAHPHRVQAAVNHARALAIAAGEAPVEAPREPELAVGRIAFLFAAAPVEDPPEPEDAAMAALVQVPPEPAQTKKRARRGMSGEGGGQ